MATWYEPESSSLLPVPVMLVTDDMAVQLRMKAILHSIGFDTNEEVFCVNNLDEALASWPRDPVGFAIVDLALSNHRGLTLIQDFYSNHASFPFVILTETGDKNGILEALTSGAIGYFNKHQDDIAIIMALRSIFRGGAFIDPFMAKHLLDILTKKDSQNLGTASDHPLTQREIEILELVGNGLTNQEIANQLHLSRHTVNGHIKHVYRKLEVSSRTKAVYTARHNGWM